MHNKFQYFLFAAVLFFCACFAHASTTTLTGTIVDEQGNPLNGVLTMRLPVPAQDTTTNTAVAPILVYFNLVNGAITGGAPLYDVTTLQPQGLTYAARAYDNAGNLQFYGNFVVTGASFNLGAATPTSVTTNNVSYILPIFPNQTNNFTAPQEFLAIESANAPDAATGFIRMGNTDLICWRNAANSADVCEGDTLVGANDFIYFSAPGGIIVNAGVVTAAAGTPINLQATSTASGAGVNALVTASAGAGSNTSGGNVVLTPGAKNGSGNNGTTVIMHGVCGATSTGCQIIASAVGCSTGTSQGDTCNFLISWPNPFDDMVYVADCWINNYNGATSIPAVISSFPQSASQVKVYIVNLNGASGSASGNVSCIGIHP